MPNKTIPFLGRNPEADTRRWRRLLNEVDDALQRVKAANRRVAARVMSVQTNQPPEGT
jgi:hypothetical protein